MIRNIEKLKESQKISSSKQRFKISSFDLRSSSDKKERQNNGLRISNQNFSVDDYRTETKTMMRRNNNDSNLNPIKVHKRNFKTNRAMNMLSSSVDRSSGQNTSFQIEHKNNGMLINDSFDYRNASFDKTTTNNLKIRRSKKSLTNRKYKLLRDRSLQKLTKNTDLSHNPLNLVKCEKVLESLGLECFGDLPSQTIADLYYARCEDLKLDPTPEQMTRFVELCRESMKMRKIKLRDMGFGKSSAKIIASVLRKVTDLSCLDLRKNILGNEGIKELCKGLECNTSVSHIDLGSNDVTSSGVNHLFNKLINHPSITSINLANADGLHRNRIGSNGCKSLNKLLKENKILSMINIADNSIGNEGLKIMLNNVDPTQSNIVYLNLSNNDLSQGCIDVLSNLLKSSNLFEIRLSENKLTDNSAYDLGYYFYRGFCHLAKLDMSCNNLTSNGASMLFQALKLNPYLTHLNLENNDLRKNDKFHKITNLLRANKIMKNLNLSKCKLNEDDAESIAEGLAHNKALVHINLSHNNIGTKGAGMIFSSLTNEKSALKSIDLSQNNIEDEAISVLCKTLSVN